MTRKCKTEITPELRKILLNTLILNPLTLDFGVAKKLKAVLPPITSVVLKAEDKEMLVIDIKKTKYKQINYLDEVTLEFKYEVRVQP